MPVLDRSALEASPLADLHAVASELSIDGYRRLRRPELISAILDKQGGADAGVPDSVEVELEPAEKKPRRTSRSRSSAKAEPEPEDKPESAATEEEKPEDEEEGASRRRRNRRGGRGRPRADEPASANGDEAPSDHDPEHNEEPVVEGVVELLAGGSGFVRVAPPEPSDDDVYISSAQVKRCELVSGDRVSGPKRAPRRSERFASLVRIETINGRPASELADSVRFDDLPAAYPSEVLKLGVDDPTLKALEGITPFGRGSRVSIVGATGAGKTETLKRIAQVLAGQEELSVHVVLAGARPEEITEWSAEGAAITPEAASSLTAPDDVVNGSIETVIDQARRLAARGANAVVLIDSLDAASRSVARRALGAARKIVDGGSLTVIAAVSAPVGGETTIVALDPVRTAAAKFPALDVLASLVIRAELLVGDRGSKAIARAHADAAKPEKK
ncbi:MAG: Rho termination factor N-terminal domain-containing protein [Solirubrobacteraceae bacterium]